MDSTVSNATTSGEAEEPYVSCIKVDGVAILPPLLNEKKRAEMRRYRLLAIEREETKKRIALENLEKKLRLREAEKEEIVPKIHDTRSLEAHAQAGSYTMFSTPSNGSPSQLSLQDLPLTSTPNIVNNIEVPDLSGLSVGDKPTLRIRLNFFERDSGDGPVERDGDKAGSEDGESVSSGGTFVIRSSLPDKQGDEDNDTTDDGDEDIYEEPTTVLRKPAKTDDTELYFRRKKPIKFFDNSDDDDFQEDDDKENANIEGASNDHDQLSSVSSMTLTNITEEERRSRDSSFALLTHGVFEKSQSTEELNKALDSESIPVPPSPAGSTRSGMAPLGLSTFQNKMQKVNPSLLKFPLDIRSPLLKGLVFPDPLERPSAVPRIPPQALEPQMKPKFDRLTAAVKGYLTRRLLHTEKIQIIIQTIRDTVELLLKLYEESPLSNQGIIEVREEDKELHGRVIQQLTGACQSFHDIFFKISAKERMAIIANDREKIRAKALRNVINRRMQASDSTLTKRNVSSATLKSMERRNVESRSPTKREYQISGRRNVKNDRSPAPTYHLPEAGSHSVKPRGVKSYRLSPKRRRLSYWGGSSQASTDGFPKVTRTTSAANVRGNVNKSSTNRPYSALPPKSTSVKRSSLAPTSYSARTARETRETNNNNNNFGSGTFVIPSGSSSTQPFHVLGTSATPRSGFTSSISSKQPSRPSMPRLNTVIPSNKTSSIKQRNGPQQGDRKGPKAF